MALFKKGRYYCFDFWYKRKRYQGSTSCTNKEAAKTWLSAFRTNLAMRRVGLVENAPPPILSVFLKGSFLDSVRQHAKKPSTRQFYEQRVKRLCEHIPFTTLTLDKIDELAVQAYKDSRLAKRLTPATINGELRTLRKALKFADDCGLIRYRRVRALPGENVRTFILDGETEKAYLAAAEYPLREVAILMLELGLRPEEALSLRKTGICDASVTVVSGKTVNARRTLPQTQRTLEVFKLCFALFPDSEWVFPGSKGRHFTRGALSNLHTALRDKMNWPREFVLYACRHTYATRLAEASGGDTFVLKEALGHANTRTTEKYVHTTAEHLRVALKRKEMLDRLMRGEVHEDTSAEKSKTS